MKGIFCLFKKQAISLGIYRCNSINYDVVGKLIYFSNSTQIVKLVSNKFNAHRLK